MTRIGKLNPGDRFRYNDEEYVVLGAKSADMHGRRRISAALWMALFPSRIDLDEDTLIEPSAVFDGYGEEG